ncbi:MAG: hypothetical protein ACTTI1_05310, partial [Prevotella intermedia]
RRKADKNFVNIYRKRSDCITTSLPACYKTYCFAFQKRRFCTVKVAVLHRKTAAFAMPNRNCHFLYELSLQNKGFFLKQQQDFLQQKKRGYIKT